MQMPIWLKKEPTLARATPAGLSVMPPLHLGKVLLGLPRKSRDLEVSRPKVASLLTVMTGVSSLKPIQNLSSQNGQALQLKKSRSTTLSMVWVSMMRGRVMELLLVMLMGQQMRMVPIQRLGISSLQSSKSTSLLLTNRQPNEQV